VTTAGVTVVVLSHNRPRLLQESLASVAAQTHRPAEVIVVDNRSLASDEVARLVARFPEYRLIANPTNLGFTGGMNAGLRAAGGEMTLLTEDDMILNPACLAELASLVAARPEVGLASGLILKHGTRQVHCGGGRFRLGGVFQLSILGAGERHTESSGEPYPVGYVTGSLVFARTEFLRDMGGFRDDFFMYFEDVELCARVERRGRKIMIVPQAIAHHFEPPPGAVPDEIEFHKAKNLVALYLLHAPARALPEFVLRYAGLSLLRDLLIRPRRFWCHLRAWGHTLAHLPGLLRDRRRLITGSHD
jgi:GT2 family glycosyltransferase